MMFQVTPHQISAPNPVGHEARNQAHVSQGLLQKCVVVMFV